MPPNTVPALSIRILIYYSGICDRFPSLPDKMCIRDRMAIGDFTTSKKVKKSSTNRSGSFAFRKMCIRDRYGTEADGYVNDVKGANVAGFMKVAKAMMAQEMCIRDRFSLSAVCRNIQYVYDSLFGRPLRNAPYAFRCDQRSLCVCLLQRQ